MFAKHVVQIEIVSLGVSWKNVAWIQGVQNSLGLRTVFERARFGTCNVVVLVHLAYLTTFHPSESSSVLGASLGANNVRSCEAINFVGSFLGRRQTGGL